MKCQRELAIDCVPARLHDTANHPDPVGRARLSWRVGDGLDVGSPLTVLEVNLFLVMRSQRRRQIFAAARHMHSLVGSRIIMLDNREKVLFGTQFLAMNDAIAKRSRRTTMC